MTALPRSLLLSFILLVSLKTQATHCRITPALNQKARQFMRLNGLIQPYEEGSTEGTSTRWTLKRAQLINGQCALLMDLCLYTQNQVYCEGQAYEVLAYRSSG